MLLHDKWYHVTTRMRNDEKSHFAQKKSQVENRLYTVLPR